MNLIIDRIEGHLAVCEKPDKSMIDIEVSKLPEGSKAGDVLLYEDGTYSLDVDETEKRKRRIEALTKDMWE